MKSIQLKAMVLSNEISLNKLSDHFGIPKKLRWDDTLVLASNKLKGIVNNPEEKKVFIFSFGSAVFFNLEHHEVNDIITYLARIEKSIDSNGRNFEDDYEIIIKEEEGLTISNDCLILNEIHHPQYDIVSTVLAKSVSLNKVEYEINLLMDSLEELVALLGKGDLRPKEKLLAKIWSRILGFKYNTISNLMLLDKPDITWDDVNAEKLYEKMSDFFELRHRYYIVKHKMDTLEDITQAFESLTQAKKSNRLEWIIIILISFEIIITLIEKCYDVIRSMF